MSPPLPESTSRKIVFGNLNKNSNFTWLRKTLSDGILISLILLFN